MRQLWRSLTAGRGLVATAVITISLGLGVHVAVFGLFDRLLLRPLPFHQPDRLVQIQLFINRNPALPQAFLPVAYADALARRTDLFTGLAYVNGATRTATRPVPGDNPLILSALSPNALDVLGVQPVLGRNFVEEDAANLADQPLLLTYETWHGRFFASDAVLNMSWTDGGVSYRVVGVLPKGFLLPSSRLLERFDGVMPFRAGRYGAGELITAPFARLEPGVSIAQARDASKATLAMVPWESTGETASGDPAARLTVRRLQSGIAALVEPYIWILFGGAWIVLAVASVNLAVLLYSWQKSREQEIGIRMALGATSGRLMRSVFFETAAVCAAGALLAWVTYSLIYTELLSVVPPTLRGFAVMAWDQRLIGATAAGALVAALAVSIVPIRAVLSVDILGTIDRHRHARSGRRAGIPAVLLGAEALLAFIVLTATMTTVPRYLKLLLGSPGFDPIDLHVAYIDHDWSRGRGEASADQSRRVRTILDAAATLPGMIGAAAALAFDPLGGEPHEDLSRVLSHPEARLFPVSSKFFEVLRIPLVAGRGFTADEVDTTAPVVVLNEAAVTGLWPGVSPAQALGRVVPLRGAKWTVLGVVRDTRKHPGALPAPALFLPFTATDTSGGTDVPVLIRMLPGRVPDPGVLQTALNERFPARRVRIESVAESLRPWLETPRLLAVLLGVAGGTAVILIAVALYAIARFEVTRRETELRIRSILGARLWQIRVMVLQQVVWPVATGVGVGSGLLLLASLGWRALADGYDPVSYASAGLIVLATAVLAAWFPIQVRSSGPAGDILRSQ